MSMKYPIGIQDLDKIRQNGFVYVDKTALVYDLVTQDSIYFLSRPRRFGKSLLVSTLDYYFRGKKEVFSGLAIDKLEKEWNEHPVLRLDFNGKNFTSPYELKNTIETFIAKSEEIYGRNSLAHTYRRLPVGVIPSYTAQAVRTSLLFLSTISALVFVSRQSYASVCIHADRVSTFFFRLVFIIINVLTKEKYHIHNVS